MTKLELLSPAGDLKIFKSVVNAGADAVYFGGDLFGARAYAKNFTVQEAAEAISYAHNHGAKAYLTVNTLLKNLEIEKHLYSYLKQYVENGIDAFIVQDFGVFSLIRDCFPDTHIHASTQMSICTKYGAQFVESQGASRIVTARELSLKEIAAIHSQCPDLEIESFIHGALCVCYSGQCLMSSIIGGRSGNRGRCAQPCRLPYTAYAGSKRLDPGGEYILSPKDFCTISSLPDMIDAGVCSFKIEGRMKSISYATGVVSVYRKYLDQYLYKGPRGYQVTEEDYRQLLDYGNRSGFTDLYLHKHNGPEMMTFKEPSHSKNETGELVCEEKLINLKCKVTARLGRPLFVEYYSNEMDLHGSFEGDVIAAAKSNPATREDIEKVITQLGNTRYRLESASIDYDDGIFLPVSALKKARRGAIEALTDSFIPGAVSHEILPFAELEENHTRTSGSTSLGLFVSVNTLEQFSIAAATDLVETIAVPIELYSEIIAMNSNKAIVVRLPEVIRDQYAGELAIPEGAAGVLVTSMDGLGLVKAQGISSERVILDHRLYTFSNRAIQAFERTGYCSNTVPYELSNGELAHRDNSNSYMIIYSRIPLMITANCTIKNTIGCKKENTTYFIRDRKGEEHPVQCNCKYCYNTIYNCRKYLAFGLKEELLGLGCRQFRLDFTTEQGGEVRQVLDSYRQVFIEGQPFRFNENTTKGHLKRGVE